MKITFIEPGGGERVVTAQAGRSLMETAVANGVGGIIAECGGNCACGTCRVFIPRDAWARIGEPGELEQDMLDFLASPNPDLRLSCQLEVTAALDGLVVEVSPEQR